MKRPRLIAGLAATAALAATSQGCALSPWDPETLPPLERFETRITAGPGTTAAYHPELEVSPGSTIQLRTRIADGQAVVYTIPTEPAREVEIGVHSESDPADEQTVTLTAAGGEELVVGNPTAFDPGYLGVERNEGDGELTLRVIAPRLTDTPQGTARFSFKLDVDPPDGG